MLALIFAVCVLVAVVCFIAVAMDLMDPDPMAGVLIIGIICTLILVCLITEKHSLGFPVTIDYLEANAVVEVISCQPEPETKEFLAIIKMPDNESRLLRLKNQIAPGLGKVIKNENRAWALEPFAAKTASPSQAEPKKENININPNQEGE